jgi:hypothetical protein
LQLGGLSPHNKGGHSLYSGGKDGVGTLGCGSAGAALLGTLNANVGRLLLLIVCRSALEQTMTHSIDEEP